MHPACELCAGACCESFAIPLPDNMEPDMARWLSLRGQIRNMRLVLEVPCENLTNAGQCGTYDTRPQPCRSYPVGGPLCRDAVARRRTDRYDAIAALF